MGWLYIMEGQPSIFDNQIFNLSSQQTKSQHCIQTQTNVYNTQQYNFDFQKFVNRENN